MNILLDLDGVLCEFVYGFTSLAKEMGLIEAPYDNSKQVEYNFKFHVDTVWKEVDNRKNWWTTLPSLLQEGEVDYINEVINNHQVNFVTSRRSSPNPDSMSVTLQTREWLLAQGIDPYLRALVYSTEGRHKGEAVKMLDIDVALDDHVGQLSEIAMAGALGIARRWQYNTVWVPGVNSVSDFFDRYIEH